MTIREAVEKNRSYRGFDPSVPMTRAQLGSLVELARLSGSAANKQPLKYFLSCEEPTNGRILKELHWAAMLPQLKLPLPGKEPVAYIVICVDSTILQNPAACAKDVGIVAQSMLLGAVEMGFGGCMLGAFNAQTLASELELDGAYIPNLVIALGKPAEDIELVDANGSDTAYYRDEAGTHFVPKRTMDTLILNQ